MDEGVLFKLAANKLRYTRITLFFLNVFERPFDDFKLAFRIAIDLRNSRTKLKAIRDFIAVEKIKKNIL